MAEILFITETNSFIVSSLEQKLKELGHDVIQKSKLCKEDSAYQNKFGLVFIYVEDRVPEFFADLKAKVLEDNIPIFVVATKEHMERIAEMMPMQFIKKHILRPININDVVTEIDKFLKAESSVEKKTILVVDDSGAMLRNVKAWLEDKYQIVLANSGVMALKYLTMNHPDLVLLDYEMPVCDGRQILEMMRAEPDFADIPVIFLTSKSDRESVMKVTALKPDGYLLKTMEPAKIVQAVDAFFEKKTV